MRRTLTSDEREALGLIHLALEDAGTTDAERLVLVEEALEIIRSY
jgi:hypothetical protein